MIVFLCCLLPVVTASSDWMRDALEDEDKLAQRFNKYLLDNGKAYKESEMKFRLRLFRNSLVDVITCNEEEVYRCALTQFSDLTLPEKKQLLGLTNITDHYRLAEEQSRLVTRSVPVSKDWRDLGAVTSVKDQGLKSDGVSISCTSGYAFAAAAALEGAYKISTGILKSFSAQELLDCTYHKIYEDYYGCNGGYSYDSWEFVRRQRHLASHADYPPTSYSGDCDMTKKNTLTEGYLQKYVAVDPEDGALAAAIAISPVAVAVIFKGDAFYYKSGIYDGMKDCQCLFDPTNHAMTAVAYTTSTFTLKNSFGESWGEAGYMTVPRGENTCRVSDFGYYPVVRALGDPTDEPPTFEATPDPGCMDSNLDCYAWAQRGECAMNPPYMLDYCKKSCHQCGGCDDNYNTEQCAKFAEYGECENNPDFMLKDCKKSCGVCGNEPEPEPTKKPEPEPTKKPEPTKAPEPEPGCVDKYADCATRAANGECTKSWAILDDCSLSCNQCHCGDNHDSCDVWKDSCATSDWMKLHCRETCHICEPEPDPDACVDKATDCAARAVDGGCHTGGQGMLEECPDTCHQCSCGDNNKYCPAWSAAGFCADSGFMKTHCRESCEICESVEPTCEDLDKDCPTLTQDGGCYDTPEYLEKCPKSCHVCDCGDNFDSCAAWAARGDCQLVDWFMEVQCKKSCGIC